MKGLNLFRIDTPFPVPPSRSLEWDFYSNWMRMPKFYLCFVLWPIDRMELVLHKSQFNKCNSKSWMAAAYRFVSEDQLSLIYLAIQSLLLLLYLRINLKSHLNTLHATHFIFNLVILWCKILYSNGKLLLILFLNFAIDGTSCFNARTTKRLHIDLKFQR